MARNWMGDYDPGNTTGWKQQGQIETRRPDGSTETSYDKSSNNPNYDPQAKRAVPVTVNPKGFNKVKNWALNKKQNWNYNARKKYIDRILKARMNKMQSGFMDSTIPGIDTMTMKELINLAPKVEAYGPGGTGKYSQTFINDVLSGKRVPPEFFTKVNSSGGMLGSGVAALANTIGPFMGGPVTQERLNELWNEYQDIQNIDPNTMSVKQMMEIYEPNRYKTIYGDDQPSGDAYPPILPIDYNTGAGTTENTEDDTTFAYRFGDTQNVGADVTRGSYIFNQGGRVPRAFGGIMDTTTGRRAYGLGSIFKSVTKPFKSVAKAAGKVLKSDFGKMAMLAGGAYLAGGYLPGGGGIGGGWSNFKNLGRHAFLKSGKNWGDKGALSLGKILGISAALPFIPGINEAKQDTMPGGGERGGRLKDSQGNEALPADLRAEVLSAYESGDTNKIKAIQDYYNFLPGLNAVRLPDVSPYLPYPNYADGGRIKAQEGGLMNLGGMEKDYRNEGGFVPIGREEKADDVPARLSVNEFVFTADAVRNAGGGDVDKGAEIMENVMKNLEKGGTISEESQGNAGAQEMFSVSERIGEVI